MPNKTNQPPGSERARDEQRENHGPVYGGEKDWSVADERGDKRFGHARNDDADPLELVKKSDEDLADDESPAAADPELQDAEQGGEIESGGEKAGFGRPEKPRNKKGNASE